MNSSSQILKVVNIYSDFILNLTIYLYSFVFTIGISGNILAFVVFSRRTFRCTIFSTYYRFMIAADSSNLVNKILTNYVPFMLNISEYRNVLLKFNWSCLFIEFINYLFPAISAWFLVSISIDRFINICKPAKLLIRKHLSFQIKVSLIIIAISSVYYIIPFYLHTYHIETKSFDKNTNTSVLNNNCNFETNKQT